MEGKAPHQTFFYSQMDIFVSSKVAKFIWRMQNVQKRIKNQISDFCDFQFLRYGCFCNQNRFIFDEFCVKNQKCSHQKWPNLHYRLELIWRSFFAWKTFFVPFLVFEIWSILYFLFAGFSWSLKFLGGPQAKDTLALTPKGIFLKATLRCYPVKCLSPSLLLTTVKYKIDNNSKTENRKNKTHEYNNFENNNVHLFRWTSFLNKKKITSTLGI